MLDKVRIRAVTELDCISADTAEKVIADDVPTRTVGEVDADDRRRPCALILAAVEDATVDRIADRTHKVEDAEAWKQRRAVTIAYVRKDTI